MCDTPRPLKRMTPQKDTVAEAWKQPVRKIELHRAVSERVLI